MTTQGQLVRDWAREHGYAVGARGKIKPAVWSAYTAAHPGFERHVPQSGTALCEPGCGRRWTGFNECHCRRCHSHFSTVANFDAHLIDSKCINPLDAKIGGTTLREKETVWGMIYVRSGEHWKSETDDALFA